MSLFVAIRPSEGVRDRLAESVRAARPTARGLRWTRPEEWHLTLVFLGGAGARLPELSAALERALDGHPAPDLVLGNWGTFPRRSGPGPHRASVLWVGAAGDGLHDLADALAAAARGAGVPVPSRPFVPHVTLARARPPRDVADTLRVLGSAPSAGWRADRVHLMESGASGRDRYRTVRTWGLPWGSESQRDPERGTS
ncbi:RNA 2',3'-cyclic phosphodiesterase [Nocardiopsis ganjiahuensis]|uniref:RNA 2',3'-cyclic phosphodiesterase n=1 Tax=Nocardiopsis ganjiahuensis TaxID=239984 RepID=UPI000369C0CB|nr:RNA 2',3'-cyclic phosphodiesterase [Nocardiopsis ganjiahuensis]